MTKNSIASIDEIRPGDKTGNVTKEDLRKIRRCFVFLGIFAMVIMVAAILIV
jgi:hypothetical protein